MKRSQTRPLPSSVILYDQDQTPGNYETPPQQKLQQQQKVILIATTHNSKFAHNKDILDDAALQIITTCFFVYDVVELDLVDTKLGHFVVPSRGRCHPTIAT